MEERYAIYASGSKMTEGFGPRIPGFDHINFRNSKPRFPNLRKKIKKIQLQLQKL